MRGGEVGQMQNEGRRRKRRKRKEQRRRKMGITDCRMKEATERGEREGEGKGGRSATVKYNRMRLGCRDSQTWLSYTRN